MYELPRHRFLELKHFCLQYWDWRKQLILADREKPGTPQDDVVSNTATRRTDLNNAIQLIEKTAWNTDTNLGSYILRSVTENLTVSQVDPPVSKDEFFELRRKFFWLLSEEKGL